MAWEKKEREEKKGVEKKEIERREEKKKRRECDTAKDQNGMLCR